MKSPKLLKDEFIKIRATSKFIDKLKNQAEKEHRTLTGFIEHALLTYLKKHPKHS